MLVIPAIDIKSGKCVRLKEGKMDQETIFSEDPLGMARQWFAKGAEILHVVDLDGAVQGKPINYDIILKIASESQHKTIQVGGGIRNLESASLYLDSGISRVVMGTSAVEEPEILHKVSSVYPDGIVLALDAYDGKLKTEGWVEESAITPLDLINSGEVSMSLAYNGRIGGAVLNDGADYVTVWDGQVLEEEWLVLMTGAPNRAAAIHFLVHASSSQAQADQAKWINYGPMRTSGLDIMLAGEPWFNTGVNIMEHMPNTDEHMKGGIMANPDWWADNGQAVNDRYAAWMAQ